MDGLPVAKKGVEIDRLQFLEKDRHFDTFLVVWLVGVVEFGRVELVVDLVPRHNPVDEARRTLYCGRCGLCTVQWLSQTASHA